MAICQRGLAVRRQRRRQHFITLVGLALVVVYGYLKFRVGLLDANPEMILAASVIVAVVAALSISIPYGPGKRLSAMPENVGYAAGRVVLSRESITPSRRSGYLGIIDNSGMRLIGRSPSPQIDVRWRSVQSIEIMRRGLILKSHWLRIQQCGEGRQANGVGADAIVISTSGRIAAEIVDGLTRR